MGGIRSPFVPLRVFEGRRGLWNPKIPSTFSIPAKVSRPNEYKELLDQQPMEKTGYGFIRDKFQWCVPRFGDCNKRFVFGEL
jgi:hypothetical protein